MSVGISRVVSPEPACGQAAPVGVPRWCAHPMRIRVCFMRKGPALAATILATAMALTGCGTTTETTTPTTTTVSQDSWDDSVNRAWKRIRTEDLPGTRHSQIDTYSDALCEARLRGLGTTDRVQILVDNGAGWSKSEARFIDRVIGEEVCIP